jgi:hypothetical protein
MEKERLERLERIKKKYQAMDPKARRELREKKGVVLDAESAKTLPREALDGVAGGCQYCVPPPSNCPKCGHTLGILFDDEDDYYWEVWCQSYDCDYETTSYEYYGF